MAHENTVSTLRTEELLAQRTWLNALAAKLVRDQAERDDLVQEAWLAALRHPRAGEKRDLRQWLGAVLRNRWRFARRTEARRSAREHEHGPRAPSPAAADLVEQAELQGILVRAVLVLDEPYRSTVLQRYFGELTCRAIARQEGVPEGTVRSRLKRGLDQLRAELDRANGGDRRAWVLALLPLAGLARVGRSLAPIAAVAVASIAVLVLGWSRFRGARAPLEISAAPSEHPMTTELVAVPSDPAGRAPLPAEAASSVPPAPLSAAAHLELLVLDPDNRPIPDASVECDEPKHALRTDERGRCRIPDSAWAPGAHGVELEIEAAGFARHAPSIERGSFSWSSPYPITLPRAVALEGRLLDADTGRGIEGGELLYGYNDLPLGRTTSGADGSFRLEGVPSGWEVELLIRAPDYASSQRLVQVSSTERPYLELALAPGVVLHGRVVDAWSGEPLAGVRAFHDVNGFEGLPDESAVELARSDAGGGIVLRVLRDEESPVLLFVQPGYCSVRQNPRTDGFEVVLLPAAAIEGTVRDPEGRAIVESEVTLVGLGRSTWIERLTLAAPKDSPLSRVSGNVPLFVPVWRTRTDEQGRFRMEVVPGCANGELIVHGPRHADELWTLESPLQPRETRHAEITVRNDATIAGVLRINGAPSPGRVQCRSQGKYAGSDWARPDGAFEIRGLPAGRLELLAYPDELDRAGYTPRPARTDAVLAEVEVAAGETRSVELDLQLPMGTIRGRVTSPSGKPRSHVSVAVGAPGDGCWRAVTDGEGAFEVRVPAEPPSYRVSVQGLPPVPVAVDTEEIVLVSPGFGRVRLRAEDAATHSVLERVTLFVRRARPNWESAGEFSAGTNGFAQWELEAGTLELAAGKPEEGYPSTLLGRFTLAEDEALELDVALEHVETVYFVLANPPLPGVCGIVLEASSGLPMEGSMFGGSPSLHIPFREGGSVPGLAAGTYRLTATFPDVVVEPAEIRLGADRSQPIELTWHRK